MKDIPDAVLRVLRDAGAPSLPLSRVHGRLLAELGPATGSYARLRGEIALRSDLFMLLEPEDPILDAELPVELRASYLDALGAGGGGEPRVALIGAYDAYDAPDALLQLDSSLIDLWRLAAQDPRLRAELTEALNRAEEIRRMLDR